MIAVDTGETAGHEQVVGINGVIDLADRAEVDIGNEGQEVRFAAALLRRAVGQGVQGENLLEGLQFLLPLAVEDSDVVAGLFFEEIAQGDLGAVRGRFFQHGVKETAVLPRPHHASSLSMK